MSCASKWDGDDTRERFRACPNCNSWIYNFEGLELPEAEALIFQRENLRNPTLYKRDDGKFMTSDCPVEVKRKKDHWMMLVTAAVVVVSIIIVLMLIPPQPKPKEPAPSATANQEEPRQKRILIPVRNADGSYHFEAAKEESLQVPFNQSSRAGGSSMPLPSGSPTAPATTTSTPVQENNEQVWQYANPADAQYSINNSSNNPAGQQNAPVPPATNLQTNPYGQPQPVRNYR